jgi:membrane-associated phospholipid phosphatase
VLNRSYRRGVSTLADPRPPQLERHADQPTSPSRVVLGRRWVAWTLLAVLVALALAAGIDGSALLLHVDRPISRWVITHRTSGLDSFFRHISFFGSTYAVLIGGGLLALLALPKCRLAAALIVTATLVRPPFEWTLKAIVDRQRPDFSRLVPGLGPSFPSGHVLAASVLWCMVPLVVSLYFRSARVWWAATTLSVVAIFLIGCSRVYLGVHWSSDVLAGFIAGALLVAVLDRAFQALHAGRLCNLALRQ